MKKNIKDFKFLYLKNDYFQICTKNQRLRNDIVLVIFNDASIECRLYMNSGNKYVKLPYDIIMLYEISKKTWTIDNIGRGTGLFVKSYKDKDTLNKLMKRYGYSKKDSEILDVEKDGIGKRKYLSKRKKHIQNHPMSNSDL